MDNELKSFEIWSCRALPDRYVEEKVKTVDAVNADEALIAEGYVAVYNGKAMLAYKGGGLSPDAAHWMEAR